MTESNLSTLKVCVNTRANLFYYSTALCSACSLKLRFRLVYILFQAKTRLIVFCDRSVLYPNQYLVLLQTGSLVCHQIKFSALFKLYELSLYFVCCLHCVENIIL